MIYRTSLELHVVGELTLGQSKLGGQVLAEEGGLDNSVEDSLINGLLVSSLGGRDGLGTFLLRSKEFLRFGSSRLLEVSVVELGIDGTDFDLGGGGDHVGLIDTTKRDTVDTERTSDEEETRVELLQHNHTLSTVTTGQEDDNGARGNGGTETGSLGNLARLLGLRDVFGRVELAGLDGRDGTLTTVLGTLDFNGLVSSDILSRSSSGVLVALVQGLLGVDGRSAVTRHTGTRVEFLDMFI
jgi:hypothetical protein